MHPHIYTGYRIDTTHHTPRHDMHASPRISSTYTLTHIRTGADCARVLRPSALHGRPTPLRPTVEA